MNMDIQKWILKSKTFWGAVVMAATTLVPAFGHMIGIDATAQDVQNIGNSITDVITAVGTAVGFVMVVLGRMQAEGKATLTPPKTN